MRYDADLKRYVKCVHDNPITKARRKRRAKSRRINRLHGQKTSH